ncbi:LysE family transporter [candidate division KSB1 bacterium]|nr:LysE family transporter [candidate division KSB1 bacterium]
MLNELSFITTGLILGTTAGLSPGPLQTLVLSETLRHSRREGIKVSFAPLLTDAPIIAITVLLLSKLSDFDWILGLISMLGAIFLAILAIETIKGIRIEAAHQPLKPQSLLKAMITNLLNPHPYMFWFLVGAPTFVKALEVSSFSAPLFIAGFYSGLLGIFIAIALLAGKFGSFLKGKSYAVVMRILGSLLLIFSMLFLKNGLAYLRII